MGEIVVSIMTVLLSYIALYFIYCLWTKDAKKYDISLSMPIKVMFFLFTGPYIILWYFIKRTKKILGTAEQFGKGETSSYLESDDSYIDMNEIDKVIEDYTQAISIDPNDANTYYLRGYLYREKGDYDQAIADWEAVLKIDPDNAEAKQDLKAAWKVRGY